MKANREGEFNLPSFLDEQKAVLPADTELTEEDPGLEEKPEEHARPLEFQIHRSQPQPAREESEEPDFEREMQEAEEEDAYDGYEDVDIPEMQQILPAKTDATAKASRETGKAAVLAEIKEDPQPEAEQKASHQPPETRSHLRQRSSMGSEISSMRSARGELRRRNHISIRR